MKRILLAILFVLTGAGSVFSSVEKKKVYFFPIIAENTHRQFSEKFSSQLKEMLNRTEVFQLQEMQLGEAVNISNENPYPDIKRYIDRNFAGKFTESAIFGFIRKESAGYRIQVYLYFIPDKNVVNVFSDKIAEEEQIQLATRECAVEFASRVLSIQSSKLFFSSALIPGLGQLKMKKYVRSALVFGSFAFITAKYFGLGNPEAVEKRYVRDSYYTNIGFIRYNYYIDGKTASKEEWESGRLEWIDHVNDVKRKKQYYQIGVGLVYVFNLFDTIKLMKNDFSRQKIRNRLGYDFITCRGNPTLLLQYRF